MQPLPSFTAAPLSNFKLAIRSLAYFRRSHLYLGLGIAAATAVIIGALVVGDSMRGSLRNLVLRRLANVSHLLQSRFFFDLETLNQVDVEAIDPSLRQCPIILLSNCTAERRSSNSQTGPADLRLASQVQVIGIDDRFLGAIEPVSRREFPEVLGSDEIAINQSLARELNAKIGDRITLKLSHPGGIPADSPMGRRDEGPVNLPRQKVVAVLSDDSIGGLRLHSNQRVHFNAFANLGALQELFEVQGRANAALVLESKASNKPDARELKWAKTLNERLKPRLEDCGLQWHHHIRKFPDHGRGETSDKAETTVFDYYQLSSQELLIDNSTAAAIIDTMREPGNTEVPGYEMLTYLANTIRKIKSPEYESEFQGRIWGNDADPFEQFGQSSDEHDRVNISKSPLGRVVPYSIVVGIHWYDSPPESDLSFRDFDPSFRRRMRPYCRVNSWLAEQLDLSVGDMIQVRFYEPETMDGELREVTVQLVVTGIEPIERPKSPFRRNRPAVYDRPPTVFNDPDLTPTVPGITNQESIANWDVPFELSYQDLILPQDDQYWEDHRLTPKIFIPMNLAREYFGSRFGATTAIRFEASSNVSEAELRHRIELALTRVRGISGFSFRPIRIEQLRAAAGTTPFDALFLSLSSFVIIAALLLISLLVKLDLQLRASQLGLMLAQGFTSQRVRRIITGEMLGVACIGSLVGIPIGLGYAKLMIVGLETWWLGAIQDRFLEFHVRPMSLILGTLAGVLASIATIYLGLRSVSQAQPLRLLRGDHEDAYSQSHSHSEQRTVKSGLGLACVSLISALVLSVLAFGQLGMVRASCFFGSGLFFLVTNLLAVRWWLLGRATVRKNPEHSGLGTMAFRAIVRNPMRSSLTIGLLSVASFLIASMSAFKVSPNSLGYGGFDLVGTTSQPIYENLSSPSARRDAIGEQADQLMGSTIIPVRMNEGEDASCANLFQVTRPTILGLSDKLQKLSALTGDFTFSWAASEQPESPWTPIQEYATGKPKDPIPVILDQNTALWSLKQGGQLGSIIELDIDGTKEYFKVVGLLSNSILQGKLIVSERNFAALFPKISGYRYFLIHTRKTGESDQIASILEQGWSDHGMDVTHSDAILEQLLGVQNTYISAFQTLGALGLLLGSLGLIAVQARSIMERRSELALMQAVGFSKWRLSQLLTTETATLLVSGLLIGIGCSALALLPYLVEIGPNLDVLNPLLMLAIILACGFVAAALAVRLALKLPLLENLRGR